MAGRRLFICYSRTDSPAVQAVAAECTQLGQDVWYDQQLSGGQQWWDAILDNIRRCDCFLFALSSASVRSKACRAELEYARALRRPILPVAVGDNVPDELLPPFLAQTQRVDPRQPNQLARALLGLEAALPLESTLPTPPPVPISYLDELSDAVERRELSLAEQRNLVGELKGRLADDERDGAIALLQRLRQRSDVYASVATEIDEVLRTLPPPRQPPSVAFGVQHSAPGSEPSARPRRRGLIAVLACVAVLAAGGIGAAVLLISGDDEGADPNTTFAETTAPPDTEPALTDPPVTAPIVPVPNTDPPTTNPPPTTPAEQPFEGVTGRAQVDWQAAGVAYSATVDTTGAGGVADVQFFDQFGAVVIVREDLVLRRDDAGWYYAGSSPRFMPDGQPAVEYQSDAFRLSQRPDGRWGFDAVCDAIGCYPAATTPL